MLKELFRNEYIRFGNSGDPSAIPADINQKLASCFQGVLAYTHQAQLYQVNGDRRWLVSTHSLALAKQLQDKGLRTARVVLSTDSPLTPAETLCPYQSDSSNVINCRNCGLCLSDHPQQKSIVFIAHGAGAKHLAKLPGIV